MPHYRIDLHAQSLDINFFEDYFVIFKDWISQFSKYSYSVEDDETINRHLHAYIVCDHAKADHVRKALTRNQFAPLIKTMTNCTQTTLKNFFHIETVNKTPLKALGYTQKFACKRRASTFTDDEILQAVEYYYTTEKYDKQQIVDKTDWRKVTSRNFHSIIEEYVNKNNLDYKNPFLVEKMVRERFTFIDMPVKTIGRAFRELRIAHSQESQADLQDCQGEYNGLEVDTDQVYRDDLADLSKFISSQNIKLPERISNLVWIYSNK